MTTDNFCFYLQNRLIQTSQTGGQRYSDTSPFSIPCLNNLSSNFLRTVVLPNSKERTETDATTPVIKTTNAATVLSTLTAVMADVAEHGAGGFSPICFRISRSVVNSFLLDD
jgi:hypothetical protein